MKLTEISDATAWDAFVRAHPQGHPLQLWGWGESKRLNNWTAHRLALVDGEDWLAGVQVLLWPIPRTPWVIAYVPRGPVAAPGSAEAARLLECLVDWAQGQQAMYLRMEPAWTGGQPGKGWRRAGHTIQMTETFTIDLRKSEEGLLEPMSRKHRQYIRKSERDGVTVGRAGEAEVGPMFALYQDTARRAGFGIHGEDYYARLHQEFGGQSYLYYAYFEGQPVAFLWLAAAGQTAYELYGGVNEQGAEVKANYFLKWRAMMEMKALGYEIYDFNGRLNEGVSRFKDGFGPDETDYIGTYDYAFNLAAYHVWERAWPVLKRVGRRVYSWRHKRS